MENPRSMVCWQPVLTDHQAFTYQALAKQANAPMVAYVSSFEDSIRKAQGWNDTQVGSIERRLVPAKGALRYCYRQLKEHQSDIHFFGSPFQQPLLMACLLMAMWLGVEFYLISEPYSPADVGYLTDEGTTVLRLKAKLRPMAYRAYAWCLHKRMSGIFAISQLSVNQYLAAGVPRDKLFPFGYFVPSDLKSAPLQSHSVAFNARDLKVIFVGSLIRRKGIDLLADAVHTIVRSGRKIQVDIFGPGALPPYLAQAEGITFRQTIAFGQAGSVIAGYDLLVLPSRYDGWGVVVNEALCAGVPVVTSDSTGAGCVAAELGAGVIFPAGNADALAEVLMRLMDDRMLRDSLKLATLPAARLLQPEVAAQYLWNVVKAPCHQKASVPSPWYPLHVE